MFLFTEIAEFVETLMTKRMVGIQLEGKQLEIFPDGQVGYNWGYHTFLDENGIAVDHGMYGIGLTTAKSGYSCFHVRVMFMFKNLHSHSLLHTNCLQTRPFSANVTNFSNLANVQICLICFGAIDQ